MKIKEIPFNELWGKVFRLKSEEFGVHTFLVSKFPAKEYDAKCMFISLVSEWAETYFYSSVMNDEILEEWKNIDEWRKNYYTTTNGESRFDRKKVAKENIKKGDKK